MILPYDGSNVKPIDLSSRVAQLVKQKGKFRGVNEASLLAEAERPDQDVENTVTEMDVDEEVKEEDPETVRNNLFKERYESIQRLG